jgi:hypothetical protein
MTFTRRQLVGVALLGATVGLWVSPGRAYSSPEPDTTTLRPCVYEDSQNCWWDAGKMGNGRGTSFVNIDGHLYFLRGVRRAG